MSRNSYARVNISLVNDEALQANCAVSFSPKNKHHSTIFDTHFPLTLFVDTNNTATATPVQSVILQCFILVPIYSQPMTHAGTKSVKIHFYNLLQYKVENCSEMAITRATTLAH